MASSSFSPHGHSTSTRDYLFRALYLRREMLLLSTYRTASARTLEVEDKDEGQRSVASSVDSMTVLRDVLLLPPLYSLDGLSLTPPASEGWDFGADPMLTPNHAWSGLVQVRSSSSPWYRGCFAFYVYFPSRYPFEPPIIELAGPLQSHPLVQERCVQHAGQLNGAGDHLVDISPRTAHLGGAVTSVSSAAHSSPGKRVFIPFEEAYATIDPMRVSVMMMLIRHMQLIFLPAQWPASWRLPSMEANRASHDSGAVNRILARQDVERRSVTQEVLLLKPFEQYVGTEVMKRFIDAWEASEESESGDVTDTVIRENADWYTREVLPHLLHS